MIAMGDNVHLSSTKRKLMTIQQLPKAPIATDDQVLLTKQQLAERLGLQVRGVENLVANRKIPAMRISGRCVRFSWPRVVAALQKFELKALE
jgi:excisionase family DNA binding protein